MSHQESMHLLEKFQFCPVCGSNRFEIHTEKSKKCNNCGFTYFLNPCASTVGVILNEKGELLVARRAEDPAKGKLDLPGGFSDCYETSEEGIAREIREETGLEVKETQFLFSLPNVYLYSEMNIHTIDMFYLCQVDTTREMMPMDDASELFWIPWDQIEPKSFGLKSIRMGVEKLLAKKDTYIRCD